MLIEEGFNDTENMEKGIFGYGVIDGTTGWKTKVYNNVAFCCLCQQFAEGTSVVLKGRGRV